MQKKNINILIAIAAMALIAGGAILVKSFYDGEKAAGINSFEACVRAGYPVAESYPRQCRAGSKNFTEDIGNALEKQDKIRLAAPLPNSTVSSPLVISGEARGIWFFEAQFPVRLVDANGQIVASTGAQAKGDWMTENFVPFEATLNFLSKPSTATGTLILEKDNPSGLPQNADQLAIPVKF